MPDIGSAVVVHVLEIGAHPGDGVAVLGVGHARFQRDLFELLATHVVQQEVGTVIVGDENIHEPVAVVVGDSHAHALPKMLAMPVSAETSVNVPSPLLRYRVFGQIRVVVGMAISAQFRISGRKKDLC